VGKKIVMILLFMLAIVFLVLASQEQAPYIKADRANRERKEMYVIEWEETNSSDEKTDPKNRRIDFEKLQSVNTDIVAWIYIPGTSIDFPVCKGIDNQYYLNRDFERKYSKTGTIFIPGDTESMKDAHIIFYGHTPGMFGTLTDFQDAEYHMQHPYLYIYTPEDTKKCRFVDSSYAKAGDKNYNRAFTLGSEEYALWLQNLDIHDDKEKQTFTLSTCTKGNDDRRYLVRFMEESE
jgi:Uncharacterized protein conserved in bacteria